MVKNGGVIIILIIGLWKTDADAAPYQAKPFEQIGNAIGCNNPEIALQYKNASEQQKTEATDPFGPQSKHIAQLGKKGNCMLPGGLDIQCFHHVKMPEGIQNTALGTMTIEGITYYIWVVASDFEKANKADLTPAECPENIMNSSLRYYTPD